MPKPPKRRHRKGLLSSMVKYPKSTPHKKERSLIRKIGFWAGAVVLGGVLVAMAAALLVTVFNPKVGQHEARGDFPVLEVRENPPGYPPADKIVADASVVIEGYATRIPLNATTRAGIEKGALLSVRYEVLPRMGVVHVQEWHRKEGAPAPDSAGTPGPPKP